MSVSFNKNGVVSAMGLEINPNLLKDSLKGLGKSYDTYDIGDYNFSEALVNGEIYTLSFKANVTEEKKGLSAYHSGGYINITPSWLSINNTGIYTYTFIATTNMASQTSGDGYGFCRIYVTNNEGAIQGSTPVTGTANVDWIKIEKGSVATPWIPNISDSEYEKNISAITENFPITKIGKDWIMANNINEI